MFRVRYGSVAFLTMFAAGCGTPPPQPKPVTTATASVAEPTPPPPEPDLSPVTEPANLVGVGKWKSAGTTVDAIKKMLTGSKLGKEFNREVDKALPADVAKYLKLDSSVDISIALDPASRDDNPEFFFAFSVPFRSVDDVKSVDNVVEVKPGIYRFGSGKAKGMQCVAARSLGDAPIRLVCGKHDKDLEALLPWMTRGMPNAAITKSDFHLEFRAKPLQDRYRGTLEQGARFAPGLVAGQLSRELGIDDPAIAEATRDVVGDGVLLASDLDKFSIDVGFDPNGAGVTLGSSLKLKSKNSWVARAMTSNNGKSGAPPAIFWQSPADSDTAAYNQGADSKLWAPVLKSLGSLLGAPLAKIGIAPADRDAIKAIISDMPLSNGPSVSATGHVTPATPLPVHAPDNSNEVVKLSQTKLGTMFGWSVSGVEGASAPYVKWAKDIEKTYNRAGIQGLLKKAAKGAKDVEIPTVKVLPAPAGLPKDTVVVEFGVVVDSDIMRDVFFKRNWDAPVPAPARPGQKPVAPPRPAKVKGSLSLKLVVMPDGANRTWIAFGADLDAIKSHLLAVKSDAPKDKTIASRAGLETLKNARTTSGGFVSFGGVLSSISGTTSASMSEREQKELASAMASMPNKGMTPVLLLGTATDDASPTNSIEVRIQKATIDDILALIARIQ